MFRLPKNRKKEICLAVLIVLAGNTMGIMQMLSERKAAQTEYLARNPYGEGAYEEKLKVKTKEGEQTVQIFVEEQKYTIQDINAYLEQAVEGLETWAEENLGEKCQISQSLEFPQSLPDNPAELSWSTNQPEILSWEGGVGSMLSREGEEVLLMCQISIGTNKKSWEKQVRVYLDEQGEQQLQQKVQKQAEELSEEASGKLYLPKRLDGEPVEYERETEQTGWMLCLASLILGIGIFPLKKEREKQDLEKRQKQMQTDYPDIIEKLVLLLRAGFSIRKAMEKVALNYRRNREKYQIGERYAYEELVKTCKEMESGIYETEAYERIGKRCNLPEYKVLSVLLVQNLKKGNQSILELLEREAASAGEERKRRARVKGEEASTKLLLPMMMQLVVVLVILMVPAFLSFL